MKHAGNDFEKRWVFSHKVNVENNSVFQSINIFINTKAAQYDRHH